MSKVVEVVFALVAVCVVLTSVGPGRTTELRTRVLVSLTAWGAVSIRLGVRLDLATIASVLILVFDRSARAGLLQTKVVRRFSTPLFAIALVAGCLTQMFRPDLADALAAEGARNDWGSLQVAYRFPVQIFRWSLMLLLPGVIVALGNQVGARLVLRYSLDAVLASVVFGFVQVFMQLIGGPWPSSQRWGALFDGNFGIRENLQRFEFLGLGIPRLYGLTGEPKHTAATILVALVVLYFFSQNGLLTRRAAFWQRLILVVGLVLTFSTGSYVLALIVLPLVQVFTPEEVSGKRSGTTRRVGALFVTFAVLAFSGVGSALVESRVSGRLDGVSNSTTSSEPKDAAAISYVINESSLWSLVGSGPGLADGLIASGFPRSQAYFLAGGPPTSTYTVSRLLVETGLVGLLVYGLFVTGVDRSAPRGTRFSLRLLAMLILVTPFLIFPFAISILALLGLRERPVRTKEPTFMELTA